MQMNDDVFGSVGSMIPDKPKDEEEVGYAVGELDSMVDDIIPEDVLIPDEVEPYEDEVFEVDYSDFEDMDIDPYGEIDENVEFPHLKFSSKELREFLKLARLMGTNDSKDLMSKSMVMQVQGDRVVMRSSDYDDYIEASMSLLNTKNIYTQPIIVATNVLVSLTKTVGEKTIIYQQGDDFMIRLLNGDMPLVLIDYPASEFVYNDAIVKVGSIDTEMFRDSLVDIGNVVRSANQPLEKRIYFEDDAAFGQNNAVLIKSEGAFGGATFDIRPKGIEILKNILARYIGIMDIYKTSEGVDVDRVVLKSEDFMYAFLVSSQTFDADNKVNLDAMLYPEGVNVDFKQLYSIVELSYDLVYSNGRVELGYSSTGLDIKVISSAAKDGLFALNGTFDGDATKLGATKFSKPLVIQSNMFRMALKSFEKSSAVKLSLVDGGLAIVSGEYVAFVGAV